MSQLINAVITNEKGEVLSSIDGNFAPIVKIAWEAGEDTYPWLTSIDEYGNTYINTRQAVYIIKEIESLHLPSDLKADTDAIIQILRNLKPHTLVAFFGD